MPDDFNGKALRFRFSSPIAAVGVREGDRRRLPVTGCGDIVDKEDNEDKEDVDAIRGTSSTSCGRTVVGTLDSQELNASEYIPIPLSIA